MPATRGGRTGVGGHRTADAASATARGHVAFAERIGPANDAFEQEADRAAAAIANGGAPARIAGWSAAGTAMVQRTCADCEKEEEEQIRRAPKDAAPPPAQAARASAPPQAPARQAPAFLVDDEGQPAAGQLRKSDFLAALRGEVCRSVDDAMRGSGRDSAGCPWIDHWLGYYATRDAGQVERALRRYAPEARGAADARDYLPIVAERVRQSAATYAATGAITGVPDDMPGGGALAGGGLLSMVGGLFFKARPGGARAASQTPESVRARLGNGHPLQGPVRSRMESAFGASFSRVRVHTDGTAARLSDQLNAHAFAVGEHVAFGAGTYRPGTPAGDALIAHELAHVVQQGGATRSNADPARQDAALERDADRSAAGAVAGLWGGARVAAAGPRLRAGLSLSRCSKDTKPPKTAADAKAGPGSKPTSKPTEAPSRTRAPIVLGDCGDMDDKTWKEKVAAATTDLKKVELLHGRLCNRTVRLAGTNCPTQEFPTDYEPIPTINFDPALNTKRRYSNAMKCDGTPLNPKATSTSSKPKILSANAGHAFLGYDPAAPKGEGPKKYVVLGPKVLEKGPLEPQQSAEHELYHAEYHLEDFDTADELHELETYVQDFKKYFPKQGSLKRGPRLDDGTQPDIYFGAAWNTLEGFYARVGASDRTLYLADLAQYYRDAPSETQLLMREWMKRHEDFQVVKDLRAELKLPKQEKKQ